MKGCSYFIAILGLCFSITTQASSPYVNQTQHTSFFFFGNAGESLISNCVLEENPSEDMALIPDQKGFCYFGFDKKDGQNETSLRVSFDELKNIHENLIKDLESYTYELLENHPPNILQKVFLFRDNDYELLEQFVVNLKNEPLPYRALFKKNFQEKDDTPQFFSKSIVKDLMSIFHKHLEPIALN